MRYLEHLGSLRKIQDTLYIVHKCTQGALALNKRWLEGPNDRKFQSFVVLSLGGKFHESN